MMYAFMYAHPYKGHLAKMLLQWRMEIIKLLVKEYGLSIDVTLVLLSQNQADPLTWVPQRWLKTMKSATKLAPLNSAMEVNDKRSDSWTKEK